MDTQRVAYYKEAIDLLRLAGNATDEAAGYLRDLELQSLSEDAYAYANNLSCLQLVAEEYLDKERS